MKRELQSKQRKMRVLSVICSTAAALTGPDRNQMTCAATSTGVKTFTLTVPFGSSSQYSVIATCATTGKICNVSITSSSVFVVNSTNVDGTTAANSILHVQVIGSDIATNY